MDSQQLGVLHRTVHVELRKAQLRRSRMERSHELPPGGPPSPLVRAPRVPYSNVRHPGRLKPRLPYPKPGTNLSSAVRSLERARPGR